MQTLTPERKAVPAGWIAALALVSGIAAGAPERLPGFDAKLAATSVSGISSGAFMAVQFHVAHSAIVRGVGVIAGGPYDCAENSSRQATRNCMQPDAAHPLPDVEQLRATTADLARTGAIDDPARLQGSRVWLFSGKADSVVKAPVVEAAARYYVPYVGADNVVYKNDLDASHTMITQDFGNPCPATGAPFLGNCQYDGAGALLAHIYGPLNPPAARPSGRLLQFDQREFLPSHDAHAHSLDDSGYVYVPKACETGHCRVHVALHGCQQQADAVGSAFYAHAGYNRWADNNRLIVLYPQTISRWGWGWPFWTFNFVWNPNACWDWWGYDGADYHTQAGNQIQAIRGMLDRLASARPAP